MDTQIPLERAKFLGGKTPPELLLGMEKLKLRESVRGFLNEKLEMGMGMGSLA